MAYESRLSLTVDSRTGERNLKRFRGELDQTENRGKKAFTNIKGLVVGLSGALAGLGATRYFNSIVRDAQEFESRMLSINALIKANGSAAGFTAETLRDQAEQLALTTLQSTRGVLDAQKVLLSFRRVSGSAFTQAIELSADLSAVLGTDMSSAALQLGKALENPIEGISALSRSGTTFTQTQKDAVKAMVETNRLAEAQALILAEVRAQVGGAGEGQAQGLAGAFDTLGQRIEEFGLASAGALDSGGQLADIITRIAQGLNKVNETIDPDPANRVFELLQKEIDLRAQLAELKSDDSLFGAPAAEIERVESQINAVYEERMALLKQEAGEQQAQADAVIASREKQLQMEEEAAAERLRIEREKQAELAKIAEEARSASVNGIITQLQNEALALQLSDRAFLQHQLNVAGATEQERELALATHDAVKALTEQAEAAKKSAEAFINPWQSAADTVAQSLQDAIASGDWEDIGDAIGGALGSSIAAIVNKQVTDSLAKDLTANSSTLAQIGGAFAGPIAGAVAGGAIQLAVSELSDFFSGSDWDPTAARQATQGTGTILGSIDAKSESIANSVDIAAKTNEQLVNINTGMLRALQNVQAGIQGAVAMTLRQSSGLSFGQMSAGAGASEGFGLVGGGFTQIGAGLFDDTLEILTFGLVDGVLGGILDSTVGFLDNLTGGLLSDIGSSVFGGDQKVVDEGIRILGGNLSDLVNETLVQAYATIKEDGGWFGSDKRFDRFQDIATNQFALVFDSIYGSVESGALALGLLPSEVQARLDDFVVRTQRISLEGLSAEERQAEIEAVFSTVFDRVTASVVPFIDDFQRAGEGLGETLVRVSTQVQLLNETATILGSTGLFTPQGLSAAADNVTSLVGGIEAFSGAIIGFEDNFLGEADKLQSTTRRLGEALGDLPLPKTRDGFLELVQAQDLTTATGQENIATLLRLQSAADQYYSLLERSQDDALSALQQSIDAQIDLVRKQQQALEDAVRLSSGETDVIFGDLANIVEAEKQSAQDRLNAAKEAVSAEAQARKDAGDEAISAARDLASTIASELSQIESSLDGLIGQILPEEMLRVSAISTLQSALETGDFAGTGEASKIAAQISDSTFSSFAEFALEQGRTANLLARVAGAAGEQMSDAERTIAALEAQSSVIDVSSRAQIASAEQIYEGEVARLEGILESAQGQIDELRGNRESVTDLEAALQGFEDAVRKEAEDRNALEKSNHESEIDRLSGIYDNAVEQLNALRGIETGILSVEDALSAFRDSLNQAPMEGGSGSGLDVSDTTQVLAWENYLKSNPDVVQAFQGDLDTSAGRAFKDLVDERGYNLAQAAHWHWENWGQREGRQGWEVSEIPAFASGGIHTGGVRLVGERGPELEFTGPSRIYSNAQSQSLLDLKPVVDAIKALETRMSSLEGYARQTTKNTSRAVSELQEQNEVGVKTREAVV